MVVHVFSHQASNIGKDSWCGLQALRRGFRQKRIMAHPAAHDFKGARAHILVEPCAAFMGRRYDIRIAANDLNWCCYFLETFLGKAENRPTWRDRQSGF